MYQTLIKPYQSLQSLVQELQELEASKHDFVADARAMRFDVEDDNIIRIKPEREDDYQLQEWIGREGIGLHRRAVRAAASRSEVGIPTNFLDKLLDNQRPEIAAGLLNDLRPNARRFVRCLKGHVRSIHSDSYRVIDNLEIAMAVLKAVKDHGGQVLQCNLSDAKMRLSFTTKGLVDYFIHEEKKHGTHSHKFLETTGLDWNGQDAGPDGRSLVHPVVTVTNSEVGEGGTQVDYGLLRARCINTAIVETAERRVHLGNRMEEGIFQRDTLEADANAIMLKLRDAIAAGLSEDTFHRLVNKANAAGERKIEAPSAAVGNLVKADVISEAEKDSILEHFLADYDKTELGLAQAISRRAQDVDSPEKVIEYEQLAGRVISGDYSRVLAVSA